MWSCGGCGGVSLLLVCSKVLKEKNEKVDQISFDTELLLL